MPVNRLYPNKEHPVWQPFFDLSVYQKFALVFTCYTVGFLILFLHQHLFLGHLLELVANPALQQGQGLGETLSSAIAAHRQTAFFLLLCILVGLGLGSFFCIQLLVHLLREMNRGLNLWRRSQLEAVTPTIEAIPVLSRDEVGDIAESANLIINDIQELARFRHVVEADETVEMIFHRLAQVLSQTIGLRSFILWQVQDNGQDIIPMVMYPDELSQETCRFNEAVECRALRTNEPICAETFAGICPLFPSSAESLHCCIPMYAGSTPLGVAMLLHPKEGRPEDRVSFHERVLQAKLFLRESLPVLHAKRLAGHLQALALHDPLTGLHNRRYLESHIQRITASALRRQADLAILMCDMDYFKRVNDEQGHEAGDLVLRKLADLMVNTVREIDLVIRYGGEEFLVLLVDCPPQSAMTVAEKIRSSVAEQPFRIGGDQVLHKTISIGISAFPTDTSAFWECVKYADVALYRAKDLGRNQVIRFEPAMWPDKEY